MKRRLSRGGGVAGISALAVTHWVTLYVRRYAGFVSEPIFNQRGTKVLNKEGGISERRESESGLRLYVFPCLQKMVLLPMKLNSIEIEMNKRDGPPTENS